MATIPTLNGSGITSAPSYLADGTPAGCHVRSSYRRPEPKSVAFDLSTEDARNKARMNDYFVNAAARSGWGTPSITEATDYELVRLSYDYWLMITLYQNHWICGKIVDTPAGDMVSAWPRITSEMKPKEITKIDSCIRKTHVKQQVLEAIKWARLFGGSGALIIIEGQESRMDEPLDLDSIQIGGFRGLIPFDRWSGIQPIGQLSTDITKPAHFNLPEYYEVWSQNGGSRFRVHASRILRFTGPTVPQPEYQAMNYWGISVYERVYEELRKRDNMSWNILNLTYRANLIGMKVPILDQMLSGLGTNQKSLIQFQAIMQAQNQSMSNQSMLLLPKDGEMTSMQYAFSGVSEVYEQFQREIAGAAEMPVTLLYGDTKGGLNQTNDADFRIYAGRIKLYQESSLRPQLEGVLYPVICMSVLGYVPDDIDLRFPSILTLDDKEKADLAKAQGDTIAGYFNAGIYTKAMALRDVKQTSDVTEIGTNITPEDIAEAEEEQAMMPAMPPGEEERPAGALSSKQGQGRQPGATDALPRHVFAGIPITVEFPAGARRTIRNTAGDVVYDRTLQFPYGYIEGTPGRDGDEIDCILGPDEGAGTVWIAEFMDLGPDVEQRQDEEKCLIGFLGESAARNAFLTMYRPEELESIEAVPIDEFRSRWIGSRATDAFRESEPPRGKGEKGGQFVKGSGGGSASTHGSPSGASGESPEHHFMPRLQERMQEAEKAKSELDQRGSWPGPRNKGESNVRLEASNARRQ